MEDLVAAVQEVLDEAPSGREVGEVVLVDQRWDDDDRLGPDPRCSWAVLDHLHRRGPQHNRPRRRSEVSAELELGRLGASGQPRRRPHVVGQPAPARHDAGAARIDHRLQCSRVQQQEVGGRERRHRIAGGEAEPIVGVRIERGSVQKLIDRETDGHVGLSERTEERVPAPGAVGVAPVGFPGFETGATAQEARSLTQQPPDGTGRRLGPARQRPGEPDALAQRERSPGPAERSRQQSGVEVHARLIGDPRLVFVGFRGARRLGAHGSLAPGHARPDRRSAHGRLGGVGAHWSYATSVAQRLKTKRLVGYRPLLTARAHNELSGPFSPWRVSLLTGALTESRSG